MRGIYLAAAGLQAGQARAGAAGRALANLQTPGHPVEGTLVAVSWADLYCLQGGARGVPVGPGPGPVWTTATRVAAGVMRATGISTDLAIEGPGFFVLADAQGEVLTRNGAFGLDAEGFLVGAGGRRVLGTAGPIRATGGELAVLADGEVRVGGATVGRLRLEFFDGPLPPALPGGVIPRPPDAVPAPGARIHQGSLEFSGRDLVEEVVDILTALRSYEATQRAARAHDETARRLLEALGNL